MNNIEREDTNAIALRLMARAYHALAIFYEIKSPADYDYFERRIMPYLIETMRADGIRDAEDATRNARAVDNVRNILTEVGRDVGSIRSQVLVEG